MDDAALRAFVPLYPAARNSDYFPTLKLKAPVARFQSAFTRDFQEVMVAPWAIVARPEDVHAGDSVKKRAQPDSSRDDPRPAARALAAFLQGTPSSAQDVRAADWLRAQALRGLASRCELDKAPLQSAQLVFALSGDTTPFLPAAQRVALWAQPAWLACPPQTRPFRPAWRWWPQWPPMITTPYSRKGDDCCRASMERRCWPMPAPAIICSVQCNMRRGSWATAQPRVN